MGYVLAVIVVATFAVGFYRIRRRHVALGPRRDLIEHESITFRIPVDVKLMLKSGRWSTKTLGGMVLIVREDAFQVTLRSKGGGALLGSEWYFEGAKSNIRFSRDPSPNIMNRDWIIVRSHDPNGDMVELALWAKDSQRSIWDSLVEAGAWAEGLPTL